MPRSWREGRVPHGNTLLGLYEGRPLPQRSVFEPFALPDRITIFQGPTSAWQRAANTCRNSWTRPYGTKWPTTSA